MTNFSELTHALLSSAHFRTPYPLPSLCRPSNGYGPLYTSSSSAPSSLFETFNSGSKFCARAGERPVADAAATAAEIRAETMAKPKNTLGKARWSSRRCRGAWPQQEARGRRGLQLPVDFAKPPSPQFGFGSARSAAALGGADSREGPGGGVPGSSIALVRLKSRAARRCCSKSARRRYSSNDRPRSVYQDSISDMISSALSAYSNSFKCSSLIMCSLHR